MDIYENSDIRLDGCSAVTLGNFDGIHLGHQKLIQTVHGYAEAEALNDVVFSFYPHPVSVVGGGRLFKTILSEDEKKTVLRKMGVGALIQYPFTKEFAAVDAFDFMDMLKKITNLKVLVVGEDYCFGRNRQGNFDMLSEYGKAHDFHVIKIPAVKRDGLRVSSTRIRQLINEGNMRKAMELLNKPYMTSGTVIDGNKIGRLIGFPTANLEAQADKLLPPDGVYATITCCADKKYFSVTNIGLNPTVGNDKRTIETYLCSFKGDLYGKEITVLFIERIRGEEKFSDVESLSKQLAADKVRACEILQNTSLEY